MEELMRWPVFQALGRSKTSLVRAARVLSEGYAALIANFDDSVFLVASPAEGVAPRLVKEIRIPKLCGKRVKLFEKGNPVLVLCEDGTVYELPAGSFNSALEIDAVEFKEVKQHVISDLSSGDCHTVALTADGRVLTWGSDTDGQCGTGQALRENVKPRILPNMDGVVNVYAASKSSACLTSGGDVYVWGSLETFGVRSILRYPTKLLQRTGCGSYCQVALSGEFGIALTANGKILVWSKKAYEGASDGVSIRPIELKDAKKRVVEIAANDRHAMAKTSSDVIYKIYRSPGLGLVNVKETSEMSLDEALAPQNEYKHLYERSVKGLLARVHDFAGSYRTIYSVPSGTTAMRQAFDNPENSDVKFIVEGGPIFVHKTVLSIQSEYFKSMFNSDWKGSENEIRIDSYSHDVYRTMLEFFYTGKVNLEDELQELLVLGHFIENPALVYECSEKIARSLTAENVCTVLTLSKAINLDRLTKSCIQFARACVSDVLRSEAFAQLSAEIGHSFVCQLVGNSFARSAEKQDSGPPSITKGEIKKPKTPEKRDLDEMQLPGASGQRQPKKPRCK